MKDTHTQFFSPDWNTIEPFASGRPLHMYHREQEEGKNFLGPQGELVRNLHVLAKTRVFFASCEDTQARLAITADDRFWLYVNGTYVGQGPAPAYPEHAWYLEYDLKPYLVTGENIIAVHLYYQGLVNRAENSGDGRFGLGAELNGCPLSWIWKESQAYEGELLGYETQFLENFDSRRWEDDWAVRSSDFEENSGWKPMLVLGWEALKERGWSYSFSLQSTREIVVEEILPRKMQEYASLPERFAQEGTVHGVFLDFGREVTGVLSASAVGREGQKITLYHGEELDADGLPRWQMRCNCDYRETWILREGRSHLVQWDYKAFRYVFLALPEGVSVSELCVRYRHYPLDRSVILFQTGGADTSLMEKIFTLCVNTIECGTQEHYVDCPSREKGQYLGDVIISSRAQVWLSGSVELLRKCIDQFTQTLEFCPGLASVAPGFLMQEIADFSLLFPELVCNDYDFTKDAAYLARNTETVRKVLAYFAGFSREDGLLVQVGEKWNLVDWPEGYRDGYEHALTRPIVAPGCHAVINGLYVGAWKRYGELEAILAEQADNPGEEEERRNCAVRAGQKAKELADAFHRTFFREETGLYADGEDSQHSALHSNIYPLYFDFIPEEKKHRIVEYLLQKGIVCGPFPAWFYLRSLARWISAADLWELVEKQWGKMLSEGATTCFEAWGKEEKWNTSFCHPWTASALLLLIENILDLRPALFGQGSRELKLPAGWDLQGRLPAICLKLPTPFRIGTVPGEGDRAQNKKQKKEQYIEKNRKDSSLEVHLSAGSVRREQLCEL